MIASMPILSAEPALFPADLFAAPPNDAVDNAAPRCWSVLHTRPRQEKSLARALHEQSVSFFLPLMSRWNRVRGKAVQSFLPLFAGYVFLYAHKDEQVLALSTRRVARLIDVTDQAQLWSDLRQIHRLVDAGVPIKAEEGLAPGTPVEIQSGPLAGLRGVIIKSASGNRFVVKVDFIQRGASVLLEDCALARLAQPADA
jgi:transcriptional antiterminator RfaH